MKLYNVPRNTKIIFYGETYTFLKLDGAYSICHDKDGLIVHISANAEVELAELGYPKDWRMYEID